ncbi:MAG TPA: TetR/AcrR family transcriptional regulator [Longimicrobium sp.]|nr:TetR/AcrR family transcriptional regulator [Longimicrobium sp.]
MRDDIKRRIAGAARALYLERGPEGVTMRAVAERVGVTATALYRHFPDKDALLREVAGEGSRLLGTHLFQALEAASALERLRRTAAAYLEFAAAQPQAYRALFDPGAGDGSSPVQPQRSAVRRFLRDGVREAMEAGEMAPGDPDETALGLWSLLHGLASLRQAGIVPPEGLGERVLTSFLRGLGALHAEPSTRHDA